MDDEILNILNEVHLNEKLKDKLESRVVKFLQFVPQLFVNGNFSKSYNLTKLKNAVSCYKVEKESNLSFDFFYCLNDDDKIDLFEYRKILEETNLSYLIFSGVQILFNYIKFCVNEMEIKNNLLVIIVDTIVKTYQVLFNNRDWFDIIEISRIVEHFLEYLVDILTSIDISTFEEKHNLYLTARKLLLLFKNQENCREVILNLIDKKLSVFLSVYQNEGSLDSGAFESVIHILSVLKVILECKYKPKEEILRTIVKNIHKKSTNSHGGDLEISNLIKLFSHLNNYVPNYVKPLMEDCKNIIIPSQDHY